MTVATETLRVNLGSGADLLPGWVNVDRFAPADIEADMLTLPFRDGAVDELYCSHALEHLSFDEAPLALGEMLRVLRPGGRVRVVVPNMEFVAAAWLHGGDRWYARQVVFGSQKHAGEFHRNGWNEQHLVDDMAEAGFDVVGSVSKWTAEYGQVSVVVEAVKP